MKILSLRHYLAFASMYLMTFSIPGFADADGHYRGVLQLSEHSQLVFGVRIAGDEVTFDSPNQGLFNHAPTEFELSNEALSLYDAGMSLRFDAKFEQRQLVGQFRQGSERAEAIPLTLQRLSAEDLASLSYEGQYVGQLQISRQQSLPLRLNLARVTQAIAPSGFIATLDSPAQQSFGIPITRVEINAEQLSFESQLLGARFVGDYQQVNDRDGYTGTFTQGREFELRLQREDGHSAVAQYRSPELGQHGGALAKLTATGEQQWQLETEYFGDHDAQVQYEIGSVTKPMVALILAQLVSAEQVALDTPLAHFFTGADPSITLARLATHTSGLPRLPANLFITANPRNPYAHFDLAALQSILAATPVSSNQQIPDYSYSNYAYGALGEALAIAAQSDLNSLFETWVFNPANMGNSTLALTGLSLPDLSQGHDASGEQVPHWQFDALAGAGAVVSTLPDMVAYVRYLMTLQADNDAAMTQMMTPQLRIADCCEQALGWILQTDDDGATFAMHSGQTGGFNSFVGFYLDGSAALVYLGNQAYDHTQNLRRQLIQLRQTSLSATAE
ncbi:CubicO group peptidase (beta-lactamase class C family) [Aliidiomarina maris]|uniref:CubicO group peptidase (Beta-lactamase class C family) n=3 Tax=Aliidiomarina maris TaxID=531312 RepID=A0A327X4H5_9GAMM|nr:CubicO group peptidase (beta-lactamase class C family) [Aliidiomarina maris]